MPYTNHNPIQIVWPKLSCTKNTILNIPKTNNFLRKAEIIYNRLVPSLDAYIDKYSIPISKEKTETDENYFNRVCTFMYTQNNHSTAKNDQRDCWPSTAIEVGRTDCALGTLVLARTLEKAGYDIGEMEYGLPGPMTHAILIIKGKYYIDQANGVIVKVTGNNSVDNIKTYQVIQNDNKDIMKKVPFRRIPVCNLKQGVAPLIWNLSNLINQTDIVSINLVNRFKLDKFYSYASWAKHNLLPENWDTTRMTSQPEWKTEIKEIDIRFK